MRKKLDTIRREELPGGCLGRQRSDKLADKEAEKAGLDVKEERIARKDAREKLEKENKEQEKKKQLPEREAKKRKKAER